VVTGPDISACPSDDASRQSLTGGVDVSTD
jgi:hypothetical protein